MVGSVRSEMVGSARNAMVGSVGNAMVGSVRNAFITSYQKDESLAELKHQAPNYISNSSCHTITLLHSVNTPQYTIYSLQSLVPFCIGGSLGANIFSGAVQRLSLIHI